jgi:hypothetical protein
MFETREPFSINFKILTFFNLWDDVSPTHKKIADGAYFIFVLCFFGLVNLSLLQLETLDDYLQIIMVTPLLVIIIVSVRIFVQKKDLVRNLLEILTEMEEENMQTKINFDKTCRFLKKFAKLIMLSTIIFSLIFSASGIFLHKLNFPMYVPKFIKSRSEVFYIYWLFESLAMTYCSVLSVSLHELACIFLIAIRAYVKQFREELKSLPKLRSFPRNYNEDKKDLVDVVQSHHKLLK